MENRCRCVVFFPAVSAEDKKRSADMVHFDCGGGGASLDLFELVQERVYRDCDQIVCGSCVPVFADTKSGRCEAYTTSY
jgi:hypothetical protein